MTTDSAPSSGEASDKHHSRRTSRQTHDRITVRTTAEQRAAIESLVAAGAYPNRSEAVRAGIEAVVQRYMQGDDGGERE